MRSLQRSISPPPTRRALDAIRQGKSHAISCKRDNARESRAHDDSSASEPTLAAIEAGVVQIRDHLAYFATHLQTVIRPLVTHTPRLSIQGLKQLYLRNQSGHGNHFVVHQHDHPISGT